MSRSGVAASPEVGTLPWWLPLPCFALVAVLLGGAALTRGVWFDEFWSLILTDPAQSSAAMRERWLNDTHPLLPNLLYRTVSELAGEGIGWRRLLLNLPPLLLLLGSTLLFAGRSKQDRAFHLLFAVLVVTIPAFAGGFTEFRSYAWQMCATAIVVQLAHFLIVGGGSAQMSRLLQILAALTVVVAINLHFVGGIIVSLAIAGLMLELWRRRAMTWLGWIGAAAVAGWAAMIVQAALQVPRIARNIDVSWIGTSTPAALGLFATGIGIVAIANPVAAWLAVRHRAGGERSVHRFAILLGAALLSSAAILVAVNALRPILVDRYLVNWLVLLCALVATLSARAIAARPLLAGLVGGAALLACLASALFFGRDRGWDATSGFIARAIEQCPSTRVFAVNPWRLSARRSRTARFEDETFAFAYRKAAREAGFQVAILPNAARYLPLSRVCPTLLWMENAGRGTQPEDVLRRLDLGVEGQARLAMYRGQNGFVLIVRPAG